jgi:hypothetical protein
MTEVALDARPTSHAPARPPLGTLAWARATGGVTDRRERMRMVARGMAVVVGSLPARTRQKLGLRNPRALQYDLNRLPVPDSAEAREAERLCEELDSPTLLNHCHRTYIWGVMLGILGGHRPDDELLYVAALLHDLALSPKHADSVPEISCFAAKGAELAVAEARGWAWSEDRAEALGDAICLHLNTGVPLERGTEGHLLQGAAALDVIGHRHWSIAPETIDAVLERYPRAEMKALGLPLFQAAARPGTRTDLLVHRLMFPTLVRHSQFAE